MDGRKSCESNSGISQGCPSGLDQNQSRTSPGPVSRPLYGSQSPRWVFSRFDVHLCLWCCSSRLYMSPPFIAKVTVNFCQFVNGPDGTEPFRTHAIYCAALHCILFRQYNYLCVFSPIIKAVIVSLHCQLPSG